jgi:hypothetical protein
MVVAGVASERVPAWAPVSAPVSAPAWALA